MKHLISGRFGHQSFSSIGMAFREGRPDLPPAVIRQPPGGFTDRVVCFYQLPAPCIWACNICLARFFKFSIPLRWHKPCCPASPEAGLLHHSKFDIQHSVFLHSLTSMPPNPSNFLTYLFLHPKIETPKNTRFKIRCSPSSAPAFRFSPYSCAEVKRFCSFLT